MNLTQADLDKAVAAGVAKALADKPVGQPPPSVVRENDNGPVTPTITQSGDAVTIKFKVSQKHGKISSTGVSIIRAMTNGNPITHNGADYKINVLCYEKI